MINYSNAVLLPNAQDNSIWVYSFNGQIYSSKTEAISAAKVYFGFKEFNIVNEVYVAESGTIDVLYNVYSVARSKGFGTYVDEQIGFSQTGVLNEWLNMRQSRCNSKIGQFVAWGEDISAVSKPVIDNELPNNWQYGTKFVRFEVNSYSKQGEIVGGAQGTTGYILEDCSTPNSTSSYRLYRKTRGFQFSATKLTPPEINDCPMLGNGSTEQALGFVGNPINVRNGVKSQREFDFTHDNLALTRTYNSYDDEWRFAHLGAQLDNDVSNTVVIRRPSGRYLVFKSVNGEWWQDGDTVSRLTATYDVSSTITSWRYVTNDSKIEIYGADGRLTRVQQAQQQLDYIYTGDVGDAHTLTVTNQQGQQLVFSIATGNKVTAVQTPQGVFSYKYNSSYMLEQVTQPDGETRQYLYGSNNNLTGIIDEQGVRFATWTYDSQDRAISSEHAGGKEKTTIDYTYQNNTVDPRVIVTNPLGKQTTYHFTKIKGHNKITQVEGHATGMCEAANKNYTYTPKGYVQSKTDWEGNVTQYTYNDRGLEISRTEAAGTSVARTITTQWHDNLNLPTQITDGNRRINRIYDSVGRLLSETITDTTTGDARTTTYTYNTQGLMASMNGARTDVNDVTTYAYDAQNRRNRVTNALGHQTRVLAFNSNNQPTRTQDANAIETRFAYDSDQRLTQMIRAQGTTQQQITQFNYDAVGNLIKVTLPSLMGSAASAGWVTYTYNDARHLTGMNDSLGNVTEYALDVQGNITATVMKDANENVLYQQTAVYDELSRLYSLTQGANNTASETNLRYNKNNQSDERIDAKNQTATQEYDALQRLVKSINNAQGETLTQYDRHDNITQVIAPNGATTTYEYNAFGDVTQMSSSDTGVTQYTYDSAGNVASMTNAHQETASYSYDALNRVTAVNYNTGNESDAEFSYDNCTYGEGRLCEATQDGTTIRYNYDQLGRITEQTQSDSTNNVSLQAQYTYNRLNQVSTLTYPSGLSVNRSYDALGKLLRIQNANGQTLFNQAWEGARVKQQTLANNWRESRSYDNQSRLARRNYVYASAGNTNYSYDPVSNITAINERLNSQESSATSTYTYDALNRINRETGIASNQFTYDENGNRLSKNSNSYTYTADSNRLIGADGKTITLDVLGNTVQDTNHLNYARRFEYTPANRLKRIESDLGEPAGEPECITYFFFWCTEYAEAEAAEQSTADYRYNALGQRVQKVVNEPRTITETTSEEVCVQYFFIFCTEYETQTTSTVTIEQVQETRYFAYNQAGQLMGEYDESGNAIHEIVWAGNQPVALIKQGQTYAIHADYLNTPRALGDSNGNIVWRLQGDAFGETQANEDPDGNGQTITFNLRFPGQYYDSESRLHYNYFRYYDPTKGRYITSDPIGLNGGLNTYGYAGSNPAKYLDPLGLKTCVLVTQNSFGFGNHTAIYGDTNGHGEPWLYDPSGGYHNTVQNFEGDVVIGPEANIKDFSEYHKNEGDKTKVVCKDTTEKEEKEMFEYASSLGNAGGPVCAWYSSNVLYGNPSFPGVDIPTFLPNTLLNDAKKDKKR